MLVYMHKIFSNTYLVPGFFVTVFGNINTVIDYYKAIL